MLVKEMIEYLKQMNPESPLASFSDDEGNEVAELYSPSIYYIGVKIGEPTPEYFDVDDILSMEFVLEEYDSLECYLEENYPDGYELREVVMI